MAGTRETSVRSYIFFTSTTLAGGGTFAENGFEFVDMEDGTPFLSHTIQIANDGATDLQFRFAPDTGSSPDHGIVLAGEVLTQDFQRKRRIFFEGTAGLAFRLWAY